MNRFGKNSAWTVAVLSMLLMGTACSNDNNNSNASGSPSPSMTASASPSASPSSSPDGGGESPSASPSASAPANSNETLEGTGTYNGLGDTNSIEIQFNGEPTPFRIDPDTADKLADWEAGTPVKFQYKESTIEADGQKLKQYTIVDIDKQ